MHWILGPQLIGIVMLIAGLIQKRFPPKHINALYGYRMASSMKNQQTWDEANNFSVGVMIKYSIWAIAIGLLTSLIAYNLELSLDTRYLIDVILIIVASIAMPVIIITSTEKHLKQVFKD